MDDLTTRLRRGFGTSAGRDAQLRGYESLCLAAAQEIERLSRQRDELAAALEKIAAVSGGVPSDIAMAALASAKATT